MNCTRFNFPGGSGFICRSGGPRERPKPCYVCGEKTVALCDFEVRAGKTCDRPVCALHRHEVGPDRDYCAGHAAGTAIAPRFAVSGVRPPPRGCSPADHQLFALLLADLDRTIDALPPGTVVVHGDAEGVDRRARDRARARGLIVESHPPNPSAHGGDYARAAMARNAYVETADRVGCWVAHWSKGGTWDAHRRAVAAGREVFVRQIHPDGRIVVIAESAARAPGLRSNAAPRSPASTVPLLGTRLRVRSGPLSFRGPGVVPVARDLCDAQRLAGKPSLGMAFAPTTALLAPAIKIRHLAEEALLRAEKLPPHLRDAEVHKALTYEREGWLRYRRTYLAGMRISAGLPRPEHLAWAERHDAAWALGFRPCPEAWWALPGLADPEGVVTFTCFCGKRWRALGHCHAIVLCEILAKLGAENLGEVRDAAPAQGDLFAGFSSAKP